MRKKFAVFTCAPITFTALAACNVPAVDPIVDKQELYGDYASPPCPEITYQDGHLNFGDDQIEAKFKRVKQSNLLETEESILFEEVGGVCRFIKTSQPRFYHFEFHDNSVAIQIFSKDFKWRRFFVKH